SPDRHFSSLTEARKLAPARAETAAASAAGLRAWLINIFFLLRNHGARFNVPAAAACLVLLTGTRPEWVIPHRRDKAARSRARKAHSSDEAHAAAAPRIQVLCRADRLPDRARPDWRGWTERLR